MDLRVPLSYLALLSLCFLFTISDALPVKSVRQYLPPKPGYVPVYIQDGDTPPDVESIYKFQDEQESSMSDEQDSEEPLLDDSSLRELRQSEEFIIQQLTDSIKENEVRGMAEEMPKTPFDKLPLS